MYCHSLLLAGVLLASSLCAQTPNFNFEQRSVNGQPTGWNRFGNDYAFGLDSITTHGGRYALRMTYQSGNNGFCASEWTIPITFGGKNITVTAYVKTNSVGVDPDTYAGLWLRLDTKGGDAVAFDNMESRGIRGTTDWKAYSVTLPLADEAETVHIGGLLIGKGTAWFDDFSVVVDGKPYTQAPPRVIKLAKAQTDTVFVKASGITLPTLTQLQIEHLTVLGKVWGFVKYHHPAVAAGNHNMDAELFRILPTVLNAASGTQRNAALSRWIATFGTVGVRSVKATTTQTAKIAHQPDFRWLNRATLGEALYAQLNAIRSAKRPDKAFYISMINQVGNPEFRHEPGYAHMTTPDAGYRLLSLFRYWNIIQYFFPYKHLIGEDWNNVLPEFVPAFAQSDDSLSYRLTALRLIGRIHDTHANLWGDRIIDEHYKGGYYAPVQTKFTGNQLVVWNNYNDSLAHRSGLRRGDIILAIDDKPVDALVEERKPYYPASNEPTRLRDIGRDMLRGHAPTCRLTIERDGSEQTLNLTRYKYKAIQNYQWKYDQGSFPKDSCYQFLRPDVGYLYLGNIKTDWLPKIFTAFKNTKGLVIDLRTYPSEFVVFSLGKYLMQPTPFAKFAAGSVQTPGLFTETDHVKVGQRGVNDAYKGKIVILVNEETQSQAEYTTMAFRQAPDALVIGSTTAGADGNISPFELPGGLRTMISGIGVYYPDGRETQRVGVGVDREVRPTQAGIRAGRDEVLERAIELIDSTK